MCAKILKIRRRNILKVSLNGKFMDKILICGKVMYIEISRANNRAFILFTKNDISSTCIDIISHLLQLIFAGRIISRQFTCVGMAYIGLDKIKHSLVHRIFLDRSGHKTLHGMAIPQSRKTAITYIPSLYPPVTLSPQFVVRKYSQSIVVMPYDTKSDIIRCPCMILSVVEIFHHLGK